jgi:hypothetical protein
MKIIFCPKCKNIKVEEITKFVEEVDSGTFMIHLIHSNCGEEVKIIPFEYISKMEFTIPNIEMDSTNICPHGFDNSDDCPVCCH